MTTLVKVYGCEKCWDQLFWCSGCVNLAYEAKPTQWKTESEIRMAKAVNHVLPSEKQYEPPREVPDAPADPENYKTTDYCQRCGASPEAGEHNPHGRCAGYVPPGQPIPPTPLEAARKAMMEASAAVIETVVARDCAYAKHRRLCEAHAEAVEVDRLACDAYRKLLTEEQGK